MKTLSKCNCSHISVTLITAWDIIDIHVLFIDLLPVCYSARLHDHNSDFFGQNNIDIG